MVTGVRAVYCRQNPSDFVIVRKGNGPSVAAIDICAQIFSMTVAYASCVDTLRIRENGFIQNGGCRDHSPPLPLQLVGGPPRSPITTPLADVRGVCDNKPPTCRKGLLRSLITPPVGVMCQAQIPPSRFQAKALRSHPHRPQSPAHQERHAINNPRMSAIHDRNTPTEREALR